MTAIINEKFYNTKYNKAILNSLKMPYLSLEDKKAVNLLIKKQIDYIQNKLSKYTTEGRKQVCKFDIRLFAAYYLNIYIFPHQYQWNTYYEDYQKVLVVAPRGGYKSTLSQGIRQIQKIVNNREEHRCIICKTFRKAEERVTRIRNILQENKRIITDFGVFFDRKFNTTSRSHEFSIIGNTHADFKTLVGYGWDSEGKTGGHYDEISMDDLTDQEECLNPVTVDKEESELFGNILNMKKGKKTKFNITATIKGHDDIYNRIIKRDTFVVIRDKAVLKGMNYIESNQDEKGNKIYSFIRKYDKKTDSNIITGVEIAPEHLNKFKVFCSHAHSLDELIIAWHENSTEFYRELQGELVGGEGNIFREEFFKYYDESLNKKGLHSITIGVDLSYGSGKDYSAIVVVGKSNQGYLFILDCYVNNELNTTEFYEHVERMYLKYKDKCHNVIMETNAGFKEIIVNYNAYSSKNGSYIPFSGIKHFKNKELRIENTLLHLIKNGTLHIPNEAIRTKHSSLNALYHQLIYFRNDAKNQVDDILDALEMAVNGMVGGSEVTYERKPRKPSDFGRKKREQLRKFKI